MAAPLRIERRQIIKTASSGSGEEQVKFYFEKLLKLIPAEAQSLFALHTLVPPTDRLTFYGWIVFCFIAIVVVRVLGTSDRAKGTPPDWTHVFISCVAFFLWLVSLGVLWPELAKERPYLIVLVMAAFTFLVPYFYKKPTA